MPDIERELAALVANLNQTLADSLLAAEITGAGEVAATVPASLLPSPGAGFASLPPTIPPVAPSSTTLFGRPPRVIFPAVDDAVARLSDSPVFAGTDFRETARAVQNGAFAITTELGEETVGDIRDLLQQNIADGPDMERFISDVQGLFEEGTGLSEARLDMVFRNNVGQSLLDGQERALQQPLVADAFPYRRKFVTTDERVRPEHALIAESGLNGTAIYRADDPVWQTFRGRWSWNCRCADGPITVEMAARLGVEEAKEWLDRAQRLADQFGGVAAQHLGEAAPAVPEHVEWPTIDGVRVMPPAEFQRQGPLQFHEWQLAEQAGRCWQFAETEHAPPGGVTIGGKRFEGGQFIPAEVLEKATEKERRELEGKEPIKMRLFRAADNPEMGRTTSFATTVETAELYQNNPGFGGTNLYATEVEIDPASLLDLSGMSETESLAAIANLIDMREYPQLKGKGIDEIVPEAGGDLNMAGIEWVAVPESYPSGTITYIYVGDDDLELEQNT